MIEGNASSLARFTEALFLYKRFVGRRPAATVMVIQRYRGLYSLWIPIPVGNRERRNTFTVVLPDSCFRNRFHMMNVGEVRDVETGEWIGACARQFGGPRVLPRDKGRCHENVREKFQLKKCYWRSGMASKSVKLRRPDKGHRAQSLPLGTDRQYSSELDGVCGVHFRLQPTVRLI